ncbi:cation:proton antiporter [Heyndrickxia oleronia]|uniref:cation:proton antiporter n=1 Tax=Heyndrickxia oleronia TaxID=38875 RepID=UPI002431110F|nr:cation:proton antiporter [Heyndrickxia oleronia]MCI1592869.1 cation:proton antiporter [Heyndrickxia oleronia]MCI1614517.1 cation:proton antiporter [Heyndrickxia oleronia]MCI1743350.1 cation:proton antiporter [Heyndrickxia oleronia]MCI1762375.1 cation:proton antiporter [Heyndrickxia oleronia]
MVILQLAIILIASKIAGSLSVRLGQPSVLGKLLIGIVLGPSVLGLVNETETLAEFSQIGVILLMFIAGLETDLEEFKRTGKASTFVGFGGIIVPLVLGYFAGIILNLTTMESWFLGLLLSATSVSISVQALKEMNKLKTPEGTTILGAAVIDDVVVIIALAFLMSFAGGDVHLTTVILKKVVFFAAAILIGWKVVPWFLKRFSSLKVTETVISSALIICFIYAYFAEYTGVAAIIGAYIAGVAISVTNFKHEVFEKVETISYSIFVPVFFTSIGVTAQFTGITKNLGIIIILSILAILTKLIGASIGAKLAGFGWNSSLGIGSAMVSRGEVALIIASIGLESKLLSQDMFAVIVVVVLVTTIVTPPMMKLFFKSHPKKKSNIA